MPSPMRRRLNGYVQAASFVINRPGHTELRKVSVEPAEHSAQGAPLLR